MKEKGKRHLAFYIGSLQKGGAERVMANLAAYFYAQGYAVTFVTTYFNPPEYFPSGACWDPQTGEDRKSAEGIHRICSDPPEQSLQGSRAANFCTRAEYLRKIWKELRPDLILSFIGMNNIMAILTSRGLHIPVVISVRADPAMEYDTRRLLLPARLLFPRAAGIILQTNDAKSFFSAAVQKKVTVLPNSLNPEFIRPLSFENRKKEIVMVGRMDDNKDQQLAVRAFASILRRDGEGKDWTLHFLGDGPDREKLRKLAEDEGIEDSVVFEGIQDHVADRIEHMSIFLLTSRTEGMPNSLLEAMSLGLACISTDCPCGGPKDLIDDGKNGYLVPVGDGKALEEKLCLLMKDESLRIGLGREASKVQKAYSPERVNAMWKACLDGFMD